MIETLTERAAAAPGVLGRVCGGRSSGEAALLRPRLRDQRSGMSHPLRGRGSPRVAVVADTERHAQAALALVDVRYEELPAATSAEQALAATRA